MNRSGHRLKGLLLLLITLSIAATGYAQGFLEKMVTLSVHAQPVSAALKEMERQGGFHFSYNSTILAKDSLVTLHINSKPVGEALYELLGGGYEYRETESHIIIHRSNNPSYYVSGYVVDVITGLRMPDVSVYEAQQLVSALTDDQGYFRMKLKGRQTQNVLNVRKVSYVDTSIVLKAGRDMVVTVPLSPKSYELDAVEVTPQSALERTWFGQFMLSSRQQMQSMNLTRFIVDKPYQVSVVPGVGTHGRMGSQVIDKVSFNILGGYTAGVNGFEIGGVFNIVKSDVRYAQVGGIFSVVGGRVDGVQVSGIVNSVLDSVEGVQVSGMVGLAGKRLRGVQVAGLASITSNDLSGVQVSGITSHTKESVTGTQVSGIISNTGGDVSGTQISGMVNLCRGTLDGLQISGIANAARKVEGMQIGLINIADTSDGYTLGLINIVKSGYHKLYFSGNEVVHLNGGVKTGTPKLYTLLFVGANPTANKLYGMGLGLGREYRLGKHFLFNPELSSQHLYMGKWDGAHILSRLQLDVGYKLNDRITVHAGPALSVYYSKPFSPAEGFQSDIPVYGSMKVMDDVHCWAGGQVGISFF